MKVLQQVFTYETNSGGSASFQSSHGQNAYQLPELKPVDGPSFIYLNEVFRLESQQAPWAAVNWKYVKLHHTLNLAAEFAAKYVCRKWILRSWRPRRDIRRQHSEQWTARGITVGGPVKSLSCIEFYPLC